ncbi:hypothetical protein A2U01_0096896, partial [Trifolium medium]|nr:hypothetical protein [Trifolium medium]
MLWWSNRVPSGRCNRQYTSSRVTVISSSGMWMLLVSPCNLSTKEVNNVRSRNEKPVLARPHIPVALMV